MQVGLCCAAESFEEMERWLSEARMNADKNSKVMLIGNKNDLEG